MHPCLTLVTFHQQYLWSPSWYMLPISKQPRLIKYAFSNPRKDFSKEDGKRENSQWKRKFKWAQFNLDFVLLLFEDLFYLVVYYGMEYSVVGFASFCFTLCVAGWFLVLFLRMKKNWQKNIFRLLLQICQAKDIIFSLHPGQSWGWNPLPCVSRTAVFHLHIPRNPNHKAEDWAG